MNLNQIIEKLENNKEKLKTYGVKRIGVFGSYVKNKQNEKSDIDIIVEFEKGKATLDNFMGLLSFLEDLFNKKVNLLTVQGVKSIRIENIRKNIEECAVYV